MAGKCPEMISLQKSYLLVAFLQVYLKLCNFASWKAFSMAKQNIHGHSSIKYRSRSCDIKKILQEEQFGLW